MSNLIEHAKRELKLIGADSKDGVYDGMLYDSCMELVTVFSKQGHSEMSASIVRDLFNKLADFKPLSKLTLDDDEWSEVGNGIYQNNRNSAVFKDGKDRRAYYIDAFYKKTRNGSTWSGSLDVPDGRSIRRCYIKDTANMPKVCIDIIDWEVNKETGLNEVGSGWWKHKMKDPDQLDKLREFYELDIDLEKP